MKDRITYALQDARREMISIGELHGDVFSRGRRALGRNIVGMEALGAGQYESLMEATSARMFSGVIYSLNRSEDECFITGEDPERHETYHFSRKGSGDFVLMGSDEAPKPFSVRLSDTVACVYEAGVPLMNELKDELGIRKKLVVAPHPSIRSTAVRVVA